MLSASQNDDTIAWYENARIADEIVYVDPDAGGTADGTSWADAYPTLQGALANRPSGAVDLWVASGTYLPDEGGGQTQGDRAASFTVPNAVALYGGFDGTDGSGGGAQETERSQRNPDPSTNNTVLTGDLGTDGFSNDNAYHVVTVESNADVKLDGFTVRDGNASTGSPDNSGAGIWAKIGTTLRLRNARLLNNAASGSGGDGGGLFSEGAVTAETVTVSGNSAADRGGGVYVTGGSSAFANVTVEDNEGGGIRVTDGGNTFDSTTVQSNAGLGIWSGGGNNTFDSTTVRSNGSRGIRADGSGNTFTEVAVTQNEGSGLQMTGGNNTFTDVTVTNNSGRGIQGGGTFTDVTVANDTTTIGSGGGIYLTGNSTFSQVTLSGNRASNSGGGLYSDGHDVDLANATVVGNSAVESGGGLYVRDATLRMVNVSFYGNEQTGTSFDGGGLYLENAGGTLANVVLSGNSAAGNGGGLYISPDGTVPVVNVTAANNSAGEEGGALYTTSSNSNDFPALRNSIVWGNTSTSSGNAQQVYVASGDLPVEHSLIEDGVPNGAFDGAGNLDQNPQFADSTGPDGIVGTANDDLRLQGPGSGGGPSPAIEAGDSGLLPSDVLDVDDNGDTSESLPLDRGGNTREMDVGQVSGSGVDMGAYESNGDPLPVELVAFDARRGADAVVLTWQTAAEQNNAGFHVQRRTEAGSFESVTFVDGAGTTTEAQSYRVRDAEPPFADSLVYRLKQVDTDGSTSVSSPVVVRQGPGATVQLHPPFPNPARKQATLRYVVPAGDAQPVRLDVYNVLGQRVATLVDDRREPGRIEQTVDTRSLSSGVYVLRLRVGDATRHRRMTVVR